MQHTAKFGGRLPSFPVVSLSVSRPPSLAARRVCGAAAKLDV